MTLEIIRPFDQEYRNGKEDCTGTGKGRAA